MQLLCGGSCAVFILWVVLNALLAPAVRSDPDAFKLTADQQESAVCRLNFGLSLCPVKCFRPDPVCGADGVTYWCGCADAFCAGASVQKLGYCDVGNGGSGTTGQALLLLHIVWLMLLGVFVLFGLL